MRFLVLIILSFLINPLQAKNAITFKKELVANVHWFPYGLVLIVLIIAVLILAKSSKKISNTQSKCKIIEKTTLNHKTKIFVIDYQGQQFLIADNQNALAIHSLQVNSQS